MGQTLMMLQDEGEIDALAALARREGVRSYLEIGSKFGGSLRKVAAALPAGSKIVSVDLPSGTRAWPESKVSLTRLIQELRTAGHDAHLIWGDSTDPKVVDQVRAHGPFDMVLIDANHTAPFLRKDWANFGPMGRMIAFHDIAWRRAPEWIGTRIDVPEFWDEIKGDFRHEEFKFHHTGKDNGIGVLWRD